MRKKSRFINRKRISSASFFDKVVSVIRVIKIELLFAILALLLSLGQYFQNSINVRINITETWRNGYTSETRNRVTRFRHFYKKCKKDYGDKTAKESVRKLIEREELFDKDIREDKCIKDLVKDEIDSIKRKERDKKAPIEYIKFALKSWRENCGNDDNCKDKFNDSVRKMFESNELFEGEISADKLIKELDSVDINSLQQKVKDREPTKDEYVEIVLKYRNAIIECLNTAEAVKAVIQSKPLPFRITIFYRDTLEGRYRDIIEELKVDLMDFIEIYRVSVPKRETEAWYVLTSRESHLNDLANVVLYFLIFSIALVSVYLIKMRMQKLGYLQENVK